MREQFEDFKFRKSSLLVIEQANNIIDEYVGEGFDLTLRQLYYQFVARDLITNNQSSYKRIGSIINDARLAGMIDWDSIKDRTREYKDVSHWTSPEEILEVYSEHFKMDTREDQQDYVEVWVEKEALAGIVKKAFRGVKHEK